MAPWTRPPERVAGAWQAFRQTGDGYPALWYGEHASIRQETGRWHLRGRGLAQYLALSVNGAWAELCRAEGLRTEADRVAERRQLWELQVVEHDVADLSSFDRWTACGLDPELAVGPHGRLRPIADALRAGGYRGVLSPSAAFDDPGAVNLTLFGERLELLQPGAMPAAAANPRPALFVPVVLLSDAAVPTRYALEHTCAVGAHHRELARWRAER